VPRLVLLQRLLDGLGRVAALGRATGTCELGPLDDPELLPIVKPATHQSLDNKDDDDDDDDDDDNDDDDDKHFSITCPYSTCLNVSQHLSNTHMH
jgi:hypothetical protein